jgi:hypothetical protein
VSRKKAKRLETKRIANISVFLDEDGRIKQWPAHDRTRIPVLEYLCGKFEKGKTYTEKEVNQKIDWWHTFGDYFLLRRSLIDYQFMARKIDGSQYWVVEKPDLEELLMYI